MGMKRSHRTSLKPLLRAFAALTLLVWLAALAFCTEHCSLGGGHGDAKHASCHSPAPVESHHGGSDSSDPTHHDSSATASCLTLKSALSDNGSTTLIQPPHYVLYALVPALLALDATMTEPDTRFVRQAWRRDWVSTPEVCLGPAHRSHAPPFLS